jgi:hypothetical protein
MKWLSLSLLTDFSLKSTLSDMSIPTSACLWGHAQKTFFYPLTVSQCLCFSVRCVSCKQHMVGSYFLTQFAILCLLIASLIPFTFSDCLLLQSFLLLCLVLPIPVYLSSCLKGFINYWIFLFCSSFFYCKSPLSIFCSDGLVVINSFSFSLVWNVLISPSIRKDSFAE